MGVYDPELVGYGTDWWFLHTLGPDIDNRVAVVDEVTCVNPYDKNKGGGGREIDALQTHQMRKEVWERIKASAVVTWETTRNVTVSIKERRARPPV